MTVASSMKQGQTAALREVWQGRVWLARAWTVLVDEPELTVLANGPGSETRVPVDEEGARLRVPPHYSWRLAEGRWEHWTIRVAHRGRRWSTLVFLNADGTLWHWYVNFEAPLRRSICGWDTLDHKLDLIVHPDGRQELKDEDELVEAAKRGVVDEQSVRDALAMVRARPAWPTGYERQPLDRRWCGARLPDNWESES